MSLDIPALVASVTAQAFAFAESIQESMSYRRVVPGTYNPTAGTDPQTTVNTTVNVISLNFESKEVNGNLIRSGDKKMLIQASELPTQPKADDYLIDSSNKRWDVTDYMVPVTGKLWIFGARAHQP